MMRVLALVPGGIGEQILFFPTLDDLKQSHPDAQIDVVVEPRAKGAYRVCKSVSEVIPYDFADQNSLADWGNLLGIIRDRQYDVVLSLNQLWAIGLLIWLTGIPTRIGYDGGSKAMFFTDLAPLKTEQYTAHRYHDLLQGLGITTPCPELTINVPKRDIDWAESEQKRLGIQESGYILIHVGSSQPTKSQGSNQIYPINNWEKIIQTLQQRQPELPLVAIQEPENQAWMDDLVRSCPGLKVSTPPDIGKLAGMIAGASLMLCTEDSAPMHLAVAVQTYTIALMGSTDPKKLLPTSDKFIGIQSSTGKIADISPQTVLERVLG